MNNYKYALKKFDIFFLFVSLILSLLIYYNKVYNKEIYVYKLDNLNYKKISKNFYDQIKKEKFLEYNFLEYNIATLEEYEFFFKKKITKFFSRYYFFTNTLSNNVMYDPNDVDLFDRHFAIPGKIDFKKKKIFFETFKNNTNYKEFLTINTSGEYFKKQNNFYLKYVKENFLLFVSKKELENIKRLINFSKNLIIYSELNVINNDDKEKFLNNFLKNIYANQIDKSINLKKISIFYKLTFHFMFLILLNLIFFLVFKFIFIVANFIKYKFYNYKIDGNFIN